MSSSVIRREVRPSVGSVLLFAGAAYIGLTVWTAIVLALAAVGALWVLIFWAPAGP